MDGRSESTGECLEAYTKTQLWNYIRCTQITFSAICIWGRGLAFLPSPACSGAPCGRLHCVFWSGSTGHWSGCDSGWRNGWRLDVGWRWLFLLDWLLCYLNPIYGSSLHLFLCLAVWTNIHQLKIKIMPDTDVDADYGNRMNLLSYLVDACDPLEIKMLRVKLDILIPL